MEMGLCLGMLCWFSFHFQFIFQNCIVNANWLLSPTYVVHINRHLQKCHEHTAQAYNQQWLDEPHCSVPGSSHRRLQNYTSIWRSEAVGIQFLPSCDQRPVVLTSLSSRWAEERRNPRANVCFHSCWPCASVQSKLYKFMCVILGNDYYGKVYCLLNNHYCSERLITMCISLCSTVVSAKIL